MELFMINNAFMLPHTALRRFSLTTLTTCTAMLWLAGCAAPQPVENVPPPPSIESYEHAAADAHTAQNALDWAGTYQTVLPCYGCAGTAISVQLRSDMTAIVRERRLGTPGEQGVAFTYRGPFRFGQGENANLITLGESHERVPAYRFFVSEGWIELRERSTGAKLSESAMYRLRQTNLR